MKKYKDQRVICTWVNYDWSDEFTVGEEYLFNKDGLNFNESDEEFYTAHLEDKYKGNTYLEKFINCWEDEVFEEG